MHDVNSQWYFCTDHELHNYAGILHVSYCVIPSCKYVTTVNNCEQIG
jgi:hypothetical protein